MGGMAPWFDSLAHVAIPHKAVHILTKGRPKEAPRQEFECLLSARMASGRHIVGPPNDTEPQVIVLGYVKPVLIEEAASESAGSYPAICQGQHSMAPSTCSQGIEDLIG